MILLAMTDSSWAGCSADLSSRSIIRLTSSPVTVRVEAPGWLLGVSSWWVMTPSIRTRGTTPMVTTMTTRLKVLSNGRLSRA
jgi:hypothetical protein